MLPGDPQGALPLLQSAVDKFRAQGDTKSSNYAFSLYNLGWALRLAGRPAERDPLPPGTPEHLRLQARDRREGAGDGAGRRGPAADRRPARRSRVGARAARRPRASTPRRSRRAAGGFARRLSGLAPCAARWLTSRWSSRPERARDRVAGLLMASSARRRWQAAASVSPALRRVRVLYAARDAVASSSGLTAAGSSGRSRAPATGTFASTCDGGDPDLSLAGVAYDRVETRRYRGLRATDGIDPRRRWHSGPPETARGAAATPTGRAPSPDAALDARNLDPPM